MPNYVQLLLSNISGKHLDIPISLSDMNPPLCKG